MVVGQAGVFQGYPTFATGVLGLKHRNNTHRFTRSRAVPLGEPQDGPPSVHTRVHDYMNLMRRRGLACLRGLHRGLLRSVLGSGLDIEAAEQGRGLRRGAPQLGGEEVVMDLSLRGSGFSGGRFCLEGKLKPWNLFSSLFFEGEP
ncbi:unnamed protein product [Effrenium voratum]|nr:unnamed protein product [Effrenium voratum]